MNKVIDLLERIGRLEKERDELKQRNGAMLERAKKLRDQVMLTWRPPRDSGCDTKAEIAQTSVMLTIAFTMGRDFMPAQMSMNQIAAIEDGLRLMNETLSPFEEFAEGDADDT